MLNTPLRTGQSLTTRNDPGQNVVAPRLRNPDLNQGKGGRCPVTVISLSCDCGLSCLHLHAGIITPKPYWALLGIRFSKCFVNRRSPSTVISPIACRASDLTEGREKQWDLVRWEEPAQTGPGSCVTPTEHEDSLMERP